MSLDNAIIDLQNQLQFQEDAIHKLDHSLAEQQKQLSQQQRQIDALAKLLTDVQQQLPADDDNQNPPHY